MKKLTIKVKVTLLCTLITAAVVAIALGSMFASERRMIRNYYRDSLHSTARLAVDEVFYEDGDLEIDRNLDELPNVRVALYSFYGDLIYGRHSFDAEFAPGKIYAAQSPDGTRWQALDVLLSPEGGESLYLRCYMASSAADSIRNAQWRFLWILLPGLVVLAALGGYGVARRAFRPVAQIAETAQGISDGSDLQKRIGLSGADDEIHRMAAVFDGMLERLEKAFERERRFTSDVSHELRTPVAGILMQSEFAKSEFATDADRREALEEIHGRAAYMSELINRLLTLARMDAHQHPLQLQQTDLTKLAGTVAKAIEAQAQQKGISVELRAGKGLPLLADETLLLQAVLNLATNAVRYGREGGWVCITAEGDGSELRLIVEDDGPGIAADALPHIFERFYQADSARHGDGAGLGLALADCIVRLHGGSIHAESALGAGSRFTIILPHTEENA